MKAKKGFIEGTLPQLLLVLISFAVIAMIISNIFSGTGGIQDKLCMAVPFFCGTQTGIDYEVSARSANAVTCAIGSAFNGFMWQGGSDFTCDEFYSQPAAGASTSGAVTGAASTGEPLRLSQVRTLKPSVSCSKDSTGKMTCTVKNFTMPQDLKEIKIAGAEITPEEWIAYYGDPNYLVYWNSFPHEEDTWNFEIEWWHHGIVALFAIIPWSKMGSIGVETAMTAVKGPSKSLLAHEAAEIVWKNTEKRELTKYLGKKLYQAAPDKAASILGKTVSELSEEEIGIIAENLGKLSKKELRNLVASVGGKTSGGYFAKEIAIEKTIAAMKETLLKRSVRKDLLIFGKFAVGEVALHALAYSSMKKYEPIGNSLAIKNPGNKTEDLKIFSLPDEMKLKPVLVKWKPGIGGITSGFKQTEVKQLHFASPCYLKEFNVTREDNILCGIYAYDGENVSCLDADVTTDDAPLVCNEFDEYSVNKNTGMNIYSKLQDLLKMKDKSLFEFDDDWNLTKIHLSWFMKEDKSGPKYQLGDIKFEREPYQTTQERGVRLSYYTDDVVIDYDFHEAGSFDDYKGRTYYANLSEGSKNVALMSIVHEDEKVMTNEEEYILHIYHVKDGTIGISADDVAVDIYDLSMCDKIMDVPRTNSYEKEQLSCNELRTISMETPMNDIKDIIEDVQKNDGKEVKIKVKPDKDMTAKELDFSSWGMGNCGGGLTKQICFSMLDKIRIEILCKGPVDLLRPEIVTEICEIDIPMLEKELRKDGKISFKRDIKIGKNEDGTLTHKVADIVYSTQYYELDNDVIVGFEDNDQDSQWDLMLLESKYKILPKIFNITLSNIDDNGVFRHITMTNCKTEGVLVTFKDNDLAGAKMDVEGDNYCMRQSSKFAKYWQAGKEIVAGIGVIATGIISGGSTTAIYVASIVGGLGIEALGAINYEHSQIWPSSAGG